MQLSSNKNDILITYSSSLKQYGSACIQLRYNTLSARHTIFCHHILRNCYLGCSGVGDVIMYFNDYSFAYTKERKNRILLPIPSIRYQHYLKYGRMYLKKVNLHVLQSVAFPGLTFCKVRVAPTATTITLAVAAVANSANRGVRRSPQRALLGLPLSVGPRLSQGGPGPDNWLI